MAQPTRPSLSITLPPNFEFHYNDGQLPKTPDQQEEAQSAIEPPPPPRQSFKVRRKRAAMPFPQPEQQMSDAVIPTIEMSEPASEMSSPMLQPTPSAIGLLAPMPSLQRLVTPPKTPIARLNTSFDHAESPAQEWDLINDSRQKMPAFERSGSVCSSFSDSSVSSCGSSAFSAPHGGSCTSPESEATDPFMEDDLPNHAKLTASQADLNASPSAKRTKVHRKVKWTQQMDDHLWLTYMTYLQDPTLTPFKMLPGTSPPLGVCHRVAAKAKRTWKERRSATPGPLDAMLSANFSFQREGSPDTIRPNAGEGAARDVRQPQWPRSEGATRRRLRVLCKRKPTLSAHYQRLLHTRSPSPFQSSSSAGRSSVPSSAESAFASHDMKMSLVTSTNPTMQPDAPIAQLTSDEMHPRPQSQRSSRPTDWFARIGRGQAHQKSLSLQSTFGLEQVANQTTGTLASPFDDASSRSHLLQSMANTKSLGRNEFHRQFGKAPSLDSPFEVQGAPTAPRSLKRRFRSDEEKPKRLSVQNIFSPAEDNGIVRNRGFSVGAVRASDNLAKLFTPPTPAVGPAQGQASTPVPATCQDHEMTEASDLPSISDLGPPGSRSAPRRLAEPTPRLGSPFTETLPVGRQSNTFPRSYLPSGNNPQPFQQRLRELAAYHAANQAS